MPTYYTLSSYMLLTIVMMTLLFCCCHYDMTTFPPDICRHISCCATFVVVAVACDITVEVTYVTPFGALHTDTAFLQARLTYPFYRPRTLPFLTILQPPYIIIPQPITVALVSLLLLIHTYCCCPAAFPLFGGPVFTTRIQPAFYPFN